MFQPLSLQPTPDPFIARELRKIDKDLRLVWGWNRYFQNLWVIERRIPPERYAAIYASVRKGDNPRFIEQPIYDNDQPIYDGDSPIYDESGAITGYEIAGYAVVGYRQLDLAPEYERVTAIERADGGFRQPSMSDVIEMKRVYAWERFHSLTRAKLERDRQEARRDEIMKKRRAEAIDEAIPEALHALGAVVTGGQPEKVLKGTEI